MMLCLLSMLMSLSRVSRIFYLSILLNLSSCNVKQSWRAYDLVLAEVEQVKVLECGSVLKVLAVHFSVHETAFQVEDMLNVPVIAFLRVAHKDQMNRFHALNSHTVDAVDSCIEACLRMLANVMEVVFERSLEGVEVTVSHGLDDEVLIVGEEKEAATLSLRLSCFEDTVSVLFRTHTILDYFLGDLV